MIPLLLTLAQLFNNYADQAGYYDLCLLIYHAADFNNPRVIAETWENLILDTHAEIEERHQLWAIHQEGGVLPDGVVPPTGEPPLPYESVSNQIQNIAHRTSLDSLIFPVDTLLPLVCSYAINQGQDASIGADPSWPVLVFLHLGVAHHLIVNVLEDIFEAQEAPFTGRRRKLVVQWIAVAVDSWVREVERRGTGGRGVDTVMASGVSGLLARADECLVQLSGGRNSDAEELLQTRKAIKDLKRVVDSILAAEPQGSLFR
jgi:nuclear pore complex protein Nup155